MPIIPATRRMWCCRRFGIVLLLWTFTASVGGAQTDLASWSQFRGPHHNAHVIAGTSLAVSSNQPPRLLWRRYIGQGYSGFVIEDNRAYTLSQTAYGQYLLCLDMDSGSVVWQRWLGLPLRVDDDYPGPFSTPAVERGRVYFTVCAGRTGCVDAAKGRLIWKINLVKMYGGEGADFGYAASPIIESERVYLPVGGSNASVVCLEASNGTTLWKSGSDKMSYASCCLITVQGQRQAVTFLQHAVVANDPYTGEELWRDEWSGRGYAQNTAAPVYQEPYLICSAPFRQGARTLRLGYESGRAKAELVWQSQVICSDILSPIAVGGYVYGFDVQGPETAREGGTKGQFKCVEIATGRQQWASDAVAHSSVLACGDRLLLLSERGELTVLAASPDRCEELFRTQVIQGRRPSWTAPVLYRNRLLVRNQESVACYYIGPAGDAPPAVTAPLASAKLSRTLVQSWLSWSETHQSPSCWKPGLGALAAWYICSLGVLAATAALAFMVRGSLPRRTVWLILTTLLGFLATPFLSSALDTLILTWPATCFAIFLLTAENRTRSKGYLFVSGALLSRMRLALLVLYCLGYILLCHHFLIYSGIGFVAGYLVAWPFTEQAPAGSSAVERPRRVLNFAIVGAFTIYYWTSALFIYWAPRLATH